MRHRDVRARGCPVTAFAGEMHRMPKAVRVRFNAGVARIRTRVTELLERIGIEDASARADSIMAEMVGTIGIARVIDDLAAAERLLSAALHSVRRKADLYQRAP